MTVHTIAPSKRTVHGYFDRTLQPIITVTSGDTIRCQTIDGSWGKAGRRLFGLECIVDQQPGDGHPLIGPIFIEGAMPGDVLEVQMEAIRPSWWGWTAAGIRPDSRRYGYSADREVLIGWHIDWDSRLARDANELGITLPISPFLGVVGTTVRAENRIHGSDQQSCSPGRPAEMITGHVPAVRVRHEALLFRMGVRDRPSPRRRSGGVKLGAA